MIFGTLAGVAVGEASGACAHTERVAMANVRAASATFLDMAKLDFIEL
jgi:hypothetical protein